VRNDHDWQKMTPVEQATLMAEIEDEKLPFTDIPNDDEELLDDGE